MRLSLLVLCLAAQARAHSGLIAVLPIDGPAEAERAALEATLRAATADALSPLGFTVLTGENTLRVLEDNGVEASRACDASCALSAAREVKARAFVSAEVQRSGDGWVLFARLSDTATGRQVASVKLENATLEGLRRDLDGQARAAWATAFEAIESSRVFVEAVNEQGAPVPADVVVGGVFLGSAPIDVDRALLDRVELVERGTARRANPRLVSPDRAQARLARFEALPEGALRDTRTSLEWSGIAADPADHGDARHACAAFTRDGRGWRLPDRDELEAFVAARRAVGQSASTAGDRFAWSGNYARHGFGLGAWCVSLDGAASVVRSHSAHAQVVCVR